jgi:hypothetical protein
MSPEPNLECSETAYRIEQILGPKKDEHNFTRTYSVDLESGKYCTDWCDRTEVLAKVTDGFIFFEINEDRAGDKIVYVNRESGDYVDRSRLFLPKGIWVDMASGKCRRMPFTGFHERKF